MKEIDNTEAKRGGWSPAGAQARWLLTATDSPVMYDE